MNAGVMHLSSQCTKSDGRTIVINNNETINFAMHSYLGLETDPRIKTAAINTINNFGMTYSCSRVMVSAPQYQEFESLLEKIFRSSIVITQTTTLANMSALTVLIQDNDMVFIDFSAHNSIRRPIATMGDLIKTKQVLHNDMDQLEREIIRSRKTKNIKNIWYVGDGIYSHNGNTCHIEGLNYLLNKYDNFFAYIDDVHSCSITGKHGCGYVRGYFDSQPEKLIISTGFAKGFGMGCGGAIIVNNKYWQRKISLCGASYIFSGPIPTPMLGAGVALAKIHLSQEITALQNKLYQNIAYFHLLLKQYNLSTYVDCHSYFSPIIFIEIGETETIVKIVQRLLQKGFYITPFIYPTVPKKRGGLRILITNHHTSEDLERLSKMLSSCISRFNCKSLDLI